MNFLERVWAFPHGCCQRSFYLCKNGYRGQYWGHFETISFAFGAELLRLCCSECDGIAETAELGRVGGVCGVYWAAEEILKKNYSVML